MKKFLICISLLVSLSSYSQNEPWKRPLKICSSTNGTSFSNIQTFQDSSGVPCMIRLPSGVLICAFQWFRQPVGSLSWDRVAVKFSSDNGVSWTSPQPVVVNGLPINFARPFDPTLILTDSGKIRMFFSDGLNMVLDTSINTYSATSDDGINYTMDAGIRFTLPDRPVVDPAVIEFRGQWHLANPNTTGGTGAYHNISPDGLNFTRVIDIASDMSHSWIGNFMLMDTNELRFYGSGMSIWYSTSPNGGMWSAFTNTNVTGGDPTVLKLSEGNFLMVYTGQSYPLSVDKNFITPENFHLDQNYPNPFNPATNLEFGISDLEFVTLRIFDMLGKEIATLVNEELSPGTYRYKFDASELAGGIYYYTLKAGEYTETRKMVLVK